MREAIGKVSVEAVRRAAKKRAGLLRPVGVFLSRFDGEYLRHDGLEHVMAFAPTRSGKGVGLLPYSELANR